MALEVITVRAPRQPGNPELREMHEKRVGKRATPVVLVVVWGNGRAAIVGPKSDGLAVVSDAEQTQIERLCEAALSTPDRHSALRLLTQALGQLDAPIPGLRNSGLFALHELEAGVPRLGEWSGSVEKGRSVLARRGRQLIEGLGYTIEPLPGPESVLLARGTRVAIALFLERPDEIEPASPHFGGLSPVSHALASADRQNLDYVVIAAGSTLRIYPVKTGVGTGRRGRTETFIELNLDLLSSAQAGYLWLLFSADALVDSGTFKTILARSEDYAADLGTRLRERVYEEVVPGLAMAIVRARRLRRPSVEQLRETYEMALLVLFRLLFLAYAEDNERLPLHQNATYRKHSLKEIGKHLAEAERRATPFESEDFYWNEVNQLWKAVDKGNRAWGVPAYNGGLFASDEGLGAKVANLTMRDEVFAPPLAALLLDDTEEGGKGPIDFRPLGVREFGTIYEGLLESELSLAETDLAVDPKTDAYIPVRGRATPVVRAGDVYLHNASGARKSSGAYYTKAFAVEHLLDRALEPALDGHKARLDARYDVREAADQFFSFRVADIAMGSGHFLVAAVDRIERRLSNYLSERPLPGVADELERLRRTARESLGPEWTGDPIEDTQLLRRQIARRCIFGVDLNPLAVELARLSLWIHTFVPGLPLSFLDANLVVGNSLVGIATFEEAAELLGTESGDLFSFTAADRLAKAREPMEKLGRLADATAAEVKKAKDFYAEARRQIASEESFLTVLTASRIDPRIREAIAGGQVATRLAAQGDVFSDALVRKAETALADLRPLHFPIVFPQVFLGTRGGFDVIVGNPPWEEATVEEDAFWARRFPGLRALPQREQEARKATLRRERADLVTEYDKAVDRAERLRSVLVSGPFPGMGTGDPDLYKAFCWRFWHLISADGGRMGVVLPRSALAAKGSSLFRMGALFAGSSVDVTTLLNTGGWVFDEAEPRYTIALVAASKGRTPKPTLELRGPYNSLNNYRVGMVKEPLVVPVASIKTWNDTASLPLLPSERSAEVFAKLRQAPRLDLNDGTSWRARPQSELHATNDKVLMDLQSKECPNGYWPVYKGESFDLWKSDTATYYAWANPRTVVPTLREKRLRSAGNKDSAFAEFGKQWLDDPGTLPCLQPRIAFRDITNRTNQRTVVVALIPAEVFVTNAAPYLLWTRGDERDQAYLLGCLSSLALDWYARRFVETHVSFFVLNPFPIPRPEALHPLRLRVIDCVGRLTGQDKRFAEWLKKLKLKPRQLAADEQNELITELDAAVAHLYGLAEADLVHIFETFHEGWDYRARLAATLKHYRQLKSLA
jgi:Eco57I restriction-modification methylase